MMRRLAGLLLFLTLVSANALGTVLNFNIDGLGNSSVIPVTYGDHVNSINNGNFHYGLGNGLTPDIGIAYLTRDAASGDIITGNSSILFWDTNYGDLVNVAWAGCSGCFGEIVLTADAGFNVRINSFDEAGWPQVDAPGQTVRVIPSTGSTFLVSPVTIIGTGPSHSSFNPNLMAQSVAIDFGFRNVNVGIDNINFDEIAVTAPVASPEPSTFLVTGIVLAISRLRRRSSCGKIK